MSTQALIFMVAVETTVTVITIYFFIKVLRSPGGPGDGDNEEEK